MQQSSQNQNSYFSQLKEDIQKKVVELEFKQEKEKIQELLEFIYEYPSYSNSSISSEHIPTSNPQPAKKRVKPPVTPENRCRAKLSNGGQCSRQRLKEGQLCGSHNKVQPYGIVTICPILNKSSKDQDAVSHEVFAVEIQGLVYYVDHHGNVFRTEDVLNDALNPTIIAQYIKTPSGYSIPGLGLY